MPGMDLGFPSGSVVKNSPAKAEDAGSIPGLGRSSGEGCHYNPLQYSCLGNPMNRGSWWALVHGVAKELDMTAIKQQQLGGLGLMVIRWIGIMNTVQLGKLQ